MPAWRSFLEVPQRHTVGVGLGRDLGVVGEAELRRDRRHDRAQMRRVQQGRRTPAEEDRLHDRRLVAQHSSGHPDLVDGGFDVRRSRRSVGLAELTGGVGVEVAIAAPGGTERDVHVYPEGSRSETCTNALG